MCKYARAATAAAAAAAAALLPASGWVAPPLPFCLTRVHCRFCARVGRAHRSNHITAVVHLAPPPAHLLQGCHDPDCRGFLSPAVQIPAEAVGELPGVEQYRQFMQTAQQHQPHGQAGAEDGRIWATDDRDPNAEQSWEDAAARAVEDTEFELAASAAAAESEFWHEAAQIAARTEASVAEAALVRSHSANGGKADRNGSSA
eukprot:SAG22_NODE_255_length_13562_cov_6.101463_13_plen_202_part_00